MLLAHGVGHDRANNRASVMEAGVVPVSRVFACDIAAVFCSLLRFVFFILRTSCTFLFMLQLVCFPPDYF